jgi:hypothetical protein
MSGLKVCNHRVGRVLSFSPVVGIGTSPTPHPQASVPPPLLPGGGAHSLAREGVEESQFRRGDIHCGTLYLYVLCVCNYRHRYVFNIKTHYEENSSVRTGSKRTAVAARL